MSQIVLELSNREDLALLISVAKRLNAHIISIKSEIKDKSHETRADVLKAMAADPLFMADVSEITEDFKFSDKEHL